MSKCRKCWIFIGMLCCMLWLTGTRASTVMEKNVPKEVSKISGVELNIKSYLGVYKGNGCFEFEQGKKCYIEWMKAHEVRLQKDKKYIVKELYREGKLYDLLVKPVEGE